MATVEFIHDYLVERSADGCARGVAVVCYSYPVVVERRVLDRRRNDIEVLLRTVLTQGEKQ